MYVGASGNSFTIECRPTFIIVLRKSEPSSRYSSLWGEKREVRNTWSVITISQKVITPVESRRKNKDRANSPYKPIITVRWVRSFAKNVKKYLTSEHDTSNVTRSNSLRPKVTATAGYGLRSCRRIVCRSEGK